MAVTTSTASRSPAAFGILAVPVLTPAAAGHREHTGKPDVGLRARGARPCGDLAVVARLVKWFPVWPE
jgi:hypothetical protein